MTTDYYQWFPTGGFTYTTSGSTALGWNLWVDSSSPSPPQIRRAESALEWLDRRVNELRVTL